MPPSLQRDSLSAVYLRLDKAEFDDAHVFTLQRNDLELSAIPEDQYYDKLNALLCSHPSHDLITAALVAAGALFGGLNTLYAAFASRIREMASLQCIGYTRRALLLSLIQESLLATLSGFSPCLYDGPRASRRDRYPILAEHFHRGAHPFNYSDRTGDRYRLGHSGHAPSALRCLQPALPVALRSS